MCPRHVGNAPGNPVGKRVTYCACAVANFSNPNRTELLLGSFGACCCQHLHLQLREHLRTDCALLLMCLDVLGHLLNHDLAAGHLLLLPLELKPQLVDLRLLLIDDFLHFHLCIIISVTFLSRPRKLVLYRLEQLLVLLDTPF